MTRRPFVLLFLTLSLAALLASCRPDDDGAENSGHRDRSDGPRNVLLITLDTTRADRLGSYGHPQAMTPALDRLATNGVRFERAFSVTPLTLPSHASLLTGTYPAVHGLRVNNAGSLGDEVGNLAQAFSQRGFRTGAFVSTWVLNSIFGLDRGFDLYDDDLAVRPDGGLPVEQSGDRTCDSALAWLDQEPDAPFFAWVHFFDPHHPYDPPEPYAGELADAYDGEIAFVDSQVQRLVDWLEGQGVLEQTLVIVAGDHGESLDEHGEPQHGFFVYDSTLRIPLIFSYAAGLPRGAVVSADVSLVDLLPTVLDLMGWATPSGIDGRSLVPAWSSAKFSRGAVYAESEYPRVAFGWAPLSTLIEDEWKYIEAPRPELYHRADDPQEKNNLLASQPTVAARLGEQLFEARQAMVPRDIGAVPVDDEALERLESLGYVGGSLDANSDDTDRRDPKDMIPVYRAYYMATGLVAESKFREALQVLVPMARRSPESDAIQALLGQAYLRLSGWREAETAFRASLRTRPDHPTNRYGLAEALRQQGKTADAITEYSSVVAAMPDLVEAHRGLALSHAALGEYDLALDDFRRCIELNPTFVNDRLNMGSVLLKLRRHDEAVATFRAALEQDPRNQMAHQSLWKALMAAGRRDEAIPALRAAHEAFPDDDQPVCMLAWLLGSGGGLRTASGTETRTMADRCVSLNPDNPLGHSVLGMIHAQSGDFDRAIEATQRALDLSIAQGNKNLSQQISNQLKTYRTLAR